MFPPLAKLPAEMAKAMGAPGGGLEGGALGAKARTAPILACANSAAKARARAASLCMTVVAPFGDGAFFTFSPEFAPGAACLCRFAAPSSAFSLGSYSGRFELTNSNQFVRLRPEAFSKSKS